MNDLIIKPGDAVNIVSSLGGRVYVRQLYSGKWEVLCTHQPDTKDSPIACDVHFQQYHELTTGVGMRFDIESQIVLTAKTKDAAQVVKGLTHKICERYAGHLEVKAALVHQRKNGVNFTVKVIAHDCTEAKAHRLCERLHKEFLTCPVIGSIFRSSYLKK